MTFTVSRKALTGVAFVVVLAVGIGIGAVLAGGGGGSDTTTVVSTAGALESPASGETPSEATGSAESTGDCASKGINNGNNEDSCVEEGTKFVVVDKGSVLELPTLDAKLLGIRTARTATSKYEGAETANGVFVTCELEITNRTHAPETFDEYQEQVSLLIDGNVYTEDFEVQNGTIQTSFLWQGTAIQPQNAQVGTVTFDIPASVLTDLEKTGNLNFANFGSEGEVLSQDEVGVIRTYQ